MHENEIVIEVAAGLVTEVLEHYSEPGAVYRVTYPNYTPIDYLSDIDDSLEIAFESVERDDAECYEKQLNRVMLMASDAIVNLRAKRVKDDLKREAVDAEVEAAFANDGEPIDEINEEAYAWALKQRGLTAEYCRKIRVG